MRKRTGLVSRRGVFPLAFTLDHVGPLTRTVADPEPNDCTLAWRLSRFSAL